MDPFERLSNHSDAANLATGMRQQILDFNSDQLEYKGLETEGETVIALLDRIIRESA